jgi:hypothetical protein
MGSTPSSVCGTSGRRYGAGRNAAAAGDPEEGAGVRVAVENLERRLADIPQRLERLRKSGQAKLSRRDGEARFLRERGGYALGYTAEIAVSEDHLIVAQRVTLNPCDVPALVPLVKEVEERTVASPEKALADAGFYSNQNVRELEARGIDVYVPDPNLARELNTGKRARTIGRNRVRSPELKLRSRAGRRVYERRMTLVEPVFGVLKQQRGMRQFRTRGPAKVATEFTLAALAYNLTRLFVRRLALESRRTGETGEIEKRNRAHANDKPSLTHTLPAAVNAFNSVKALAAAVMASSLSAPSATLQPRLILRFASRQILSPHYNRTHAPEDRHPPRRRHRSRSHR